jgi:hypothetical protein
MCKNVRLLERVPDMSLELGEVTQDRALLGYEIRGLRVHRVESKVYICVCNLRCVWNDPKE